MRVIATLFLSILLLGALKAPRQNMLVFHPSFDAQKTIGAISVNQIISLSKELIVVGEGDKWVRLYDLKRGSTLWWTKVKGGLSVASMIGNKVFLASLDGELYALETKTGKLSWQKRHQGYTYKKPVNAPCGVFIQTANQQLLCYDIESGQEKFSTPMGGGFNGATVIRSYTTPIVHNGQVFVASDAGVILKVDGQSGKILQRSSPVSVGSKFRGVLGDLYVSGQSLLFGEYGGKLNKLDISTFKLTQTESFGRLYDVKYNADSILVSTKNGMIKSLDLVSLKQKWAYQHDENVSHLDWVSGAWYGAGSRGSLFSLDVTGKLRWRDFLETELRQDIFPCVDSVCFSSASSSLYLYRP